MPAPQKKTSGAEIEELIALLSRLPGLGPRSARRAALHLIKKREQLLLPLARALGLAAEKIAICKECGNIDTLEPCAIWLGLLSSRCGAKRVTYPGYAPLFTPCGRTKFRRHMTQLFQSEALGACLHRRKEPPAPRSRS